jgi:hypothetical protein
VGEGRCLDGTNLSSKEAETIRSILEGVVEEQLHADAHAEEWTVVGA